MFLLPEKGVTARNTLQHRFGIVFPLATNIYITTMAEQYFYKKRVSSLSNVIACERGEEIFKKSYFFLLIQ